MNSQDCGLSNEAFSGGTPDDEFTKADRVRLVRQWWYEYAVVLRDPHQGQVSLTRLRAVQDALEHFGVVTPGRQMTRVGAEDLADDCDRLRRLRGAL